MYFNFNLLSNPSNPPKHDSPQYETARVTLHCAQPFLKTVAQAFKGIMAKKQIFICSENAGEAFLVNPPVVYNIVNP